MWYSHVFVFQAEDGIRDLVRSRGLGDVYKRQGLHSASDDLLWEAKQHGFSDRQLSHLWDTDDLLAVSYTHLTLPTSDLV